MPKIYIQANKTAVLHIPLYDKKFYFIIGTHTYATRMVKQRYDVDCSFDNRGGCVTELWHGATNNKAYVFYIPEWYYSIQDYAILAHESFHLAHCILDGIKSTGEPIILSDDVTEPFAYLLEYIYGEVLQQIVKAIKH